MVREEYVVILDFLPYGHPEPGGRRKEPIAQAIGERSFTLLELIFRLGSDLFFVPRDRIRLDDYRAHIKRIRPIKFEELTASARSELPYAIEDIVSRQEDRFVRFFNEAGPITPRLHQLQLIPGIGQKGLWKVLEARNEKPFESFEDIAKRTKVLQDPKKAVVKRILFELEHMEDRTGHAKYKLFVGRGARY